MSSRQTLHPGLSRRKVLKYGLYGSLAAGLSPSLWLGGCSKRYRGDRPNIILITLDTTRADRLGCYGYKRPTSPNLDKLASESVLYTKAIAPSSWTLPSHASLFTGKFTSSHGVRYHPEGPLHLTDAIRGPESWRIYRARGLGQNELTLAQILKETGYTTAAVAGGPWLKRVFGLDKGFDYYDDAQISTVNGRLARQVTASAVNWVEKSRKKEFFLFLNYFDPHGPYGPPEGFTWAFLPKGAKLDIRRLSAKEKNALYDAEILYMDHYIGKLLQRLKDLNLYDNTWIIVTADHGELLGEHRKFGHGHYLYQEELHIPLFLKYPGTEVSPARKDVQLQLTDVFAMILKRLRIKIPDGLQAGAPPQIGHPLLAETYPLEAISRDGHWRALFEGQLKFIWNSKGNHLLFNLKNDPHERVNLTARKPQLATRMLTELEQHLAKLPQPGPAAPAQELDEETKKALESLGYVE